MTQIATRLSSVAAIVIGAVFIAIGLAQSPNGPAGRRSFEVASIKLNKTCADRGQGRDERPIVSPGRMQMNCMTLGALIDLAYSRFANGVSLSHQVLEIMRAPGWIRSERYDVAAKAENNAGVAQMSGPMLQTLLEDRFQLRIHRATKEAAVYALSVSKKGLKLEPPKEGGCVPRDFDHLAEGRGGGPIRGVYFCNEAAVTAERGAVMIAGYGMKMTAFTEALNFDSLLDRPVIDRTGYMGTFDVELKFSPMVFNDGGGKGGGRVNAGSAPPIDTAPSILDALEALGLKLEPTKGPVEFLVIDRVERPSEN
jgi:uncharacterized protein (TIGR03435 family)